jgi:hypothetical protein
MLLSAEKLSSLLPQGVRYVIVNGMTSAHYQPARFTEDFALNPLAQSLKSVRSL